VLQVFFFATARQPSQALLTYFDRFRLITPHSEHLQQDNRDTTSAMLRAIRLRHLSFLSKQEIVIITKHRAMKSSAIFHRLEQSPW